MKKVLVLTLALLLVFSGTAAFARTSTNLTITMKATNTYTWMVPDAKTDCQFNAVQMWGTLDVYNTNIATGKTLQLSCRSQNSYEKTLPATIEDNTVQKFKMKNVGTGLSSYTFDYMLYYNELPLDESGTDLVYPVINNNGINSMDDATSMMVKQHGCTPLNKCKVLKIQYQVTARSKTTVYPYLLAEITGNEEKHIGVYYYIEVPSVLMKGKYQDIVTFFAKVV